MKVIAEVLLGMGALANVSICAIIIIDIMKDKDSK
jgi:hypothetical protein